jgi:hypothetical protein
MQVHNGWILVLGHGCGYVRKKRQHAAAIIPVARTELVRPDCSNEENTSIWTQIEGLSASSWTAHAFGKPEIAQSLRLALLTQVPAFFCSERLKKVIFEIVNSTLILFKLWLIPDIVFNLLLRPPGLDDEFKHTQRSSCTIA